MQKLLRSALAVVLFSVFLSFLPGLSVSPAGSIAARIGIVYIAIITLLTFVFADGWGDGVILGALLAIAVIGVWCFMNYREEESLIMVHALIVAVVACVLSYMIFMVSKDLLGIPCEST